MIERCKLTRNLNGWRRSEPRITFQWSGRRGQCSMMMSRATCPTYLPPPRSQRPSDERWMARGGPEWHPSRGWMLASRVAGLAYHPGGRALPPPYPGDCLLPPQANKPPRGCGYHCSPEWIKAATTSATQYPPRIYTLSLEDKINSIPLLGVFSLNRGPASCAPVYKWRFLAAGAWWCGWELVRPWGPGRPDD